MATFRPVPGSDRKRLAEILRYAFAPQTGPVSEEPDGEWPPTLFDQRGLYVSDQLRSTCKLYYLDAWIREDVGRIGGLGAVATPPEYRRNGHIRELCRHALGEFEENGAGLVALWPFETSFYANLGWASAHHVTKYACPPELLPTHDAAGQMMRLTVDDWHRLREAERAHGDDVALSLRRSEQWWRERTLTNWTGGTEPYIYGYERDGEIAGYLTYTVADDETETLEVETLASADEEAYRAILSFLGTHGAQIEKISYKRAEESALLDRVTEPERVDCEIQPGPMVRLTSPAALELYSLPPAVELDATLAITDPLYPDNDGVYRLAVRDGEITVSEESTHSEKADARLDIGTLSQLLVGTHSVEQARRLDQLQMRDNTVLDELHAAFGPQQVNLGEFF